MKITDLSIPLGFEQKYWNIMKPTYIDGNPSLNTRARRFFGNTLARNGARSPFLLLAPYWNALTPEEKLTWNEGRESSNHYPFAWFVRNNAPRLFTGNDVVSTPDIIPYPSGYLEIPVNDHNVIVRVDLNNAVQNVARIPHNKYARAIYPISFDHLPIGQGAVQFYGRDVSIGTGGFIEFSLTRLTTDSLDESHEVTFAMNPTPSAGRYDCGVLFPWPSSNTPDYVNGYTLKVLFHNISGKFYFSNWLSTCSDSNQGGISISVDPDLRRVGRDWVGAFVTGTNSWYLDTGQPDDIFDTRLSALNGLT